MNPGKTYEDLEIGMSREVTHLVTEADVDSFAKISGDYNPLHMDEAYAKASKFGGRIAHGALTASYVSAILGNDLPGPGSIFLAMNLKFKRPVKIGDTVIAIASVGEKKRHGIVSMNVKCVVDGKPVIQGVAEVMVPHRTAKKDD